MVIKHVNLLWESSISSTCNILCMCGGRVIWCMHCICKVHLVLFTWEYLAKYRAAWRLILIIHAPHTHTPTGRIADSLSGDKPGATCLTDAVFLLTSSFHLSPPDSFPHHFSGLFYPHWGFHSESKPHRIQLYWIRGGIYTHQHHAVKPGSLHKTTTENEQPFRVLVFDRGGRVVGLLHHENNKGFVGQHTELCVCAFVNTAAWRQSQESCESSCRAVSWEKRQVEEF